MCIGIDSLPFPTEEQSNLAEPYGVDSEIPPTGVVVNREVRFLTIPVEYVYPDQSNLDAAQIALQVFTQVF